MKPLILVMGNKGTNPFPTEKEKFRQEVEERFKDYGTLEQCRKCHRHCKIPAAPGLISFVCTTFQGGKEMS